MEYPSVIITVPLTEIDGIVDMWLKQFNNLKYPHDKIYLYFLMNNMYHPADDFRFKEKGRYTYESIEIFQDDYKDEFMGIDMDYFPLPENMEYLAIEDENERKKMLRKEILIPVFNRCFKQYGKADTLYFMANDHLIRDRYLFHKFYQVYQQLTNDLSTILISDFFIDIQNFADHVIPEKRIQTNFYRMVKGHRTTIPISEIKPSKRSKDYIEVDYFSGNMFFPSNSLLQYIEFDTDYIDHDFEFRFCEQLKEAGFTFLGLISTFNFHLNYPSFPFF
tara:strand:- start:655 stop:1485 length:831 start_codon:yes stop_codon:yes gene_type:complete